MSKSSRSLRTVSAHRLLQRIPRAVALALEGLLGRRLLGQVQTRVSDVALYAGPGLEDRADLVDRLESGLDVLATHAPCVLTRLRVDIAGLAIANVGQTQFWARTRVIVIPPRVLDALPAAVLASELVHEGTHARIEKAGVPAWPDLLPRIERRCVREQLRFLRSLPPDVLPDRERYFRRLEQAAEKSWWGPVDRVRSMRRALREGRATSSPRADGG